ncbi:hypothetical protein DXV75_02645 [Alteromonas aestuariivivens]|uniref:Sulfatase N-terminal domain-containing protein n=1 Tax=Alteromonas aestuariivivens TaxID=1938339 RepID=A0A3D8MFS8_9ALTE|nr:sulfatase-like hydrolase/transferase [Alteromonas aestuariivivens]RDV29364.1 hypothetical protein DXV75_02645 [Alteromonas aestuariivivens]
MNFIVRIQCFVLSVGLVIGGCASPTSQEQLSSQSATDKPNFLFIAVDDLNVYNTVLGDHETSFLRKVYPDDSVRQSVIGRLTPNLQELARQGVTFSNAYSAAPLCGPSRTALLTGVPPHVSGYYQHDRHFRAYSSLTDTVTLPQYLKQNGYFTSGIGKVFHKGRSYLDRGYFSDWPDQIYSWSHWVEVNSGTSSQHDSVQDNSEQLSRYWHNDGSKPAFTRFGVTQVPTELSNDYLNASHIANLMVDGQATRKDVNGQIQQVVLPKEQPFFLAAGIFAPHLPWVVEQQYYDLFPLEEMAIDDELMAWLEWDARDLADSGKNLVSKSSFQDMLQYGLTLDGVGGDLNAWKAKFQAYLATIAYADRALGVLREAIDRNPRRDNTIVVLWSDHGYHVGDKFREGKITLWEAANHANLLIIDPRREKNQTVESPVSLQDIYPTVVSLAGLGRPEHVYGEDLTDMLKQPQATRDRVILNTNGEGNHALRDLQYRYLRYANGDEELYQMISDPLEQINLAGLPAFEPILKKYRRALEQELANPAGYHKTNQK